MTSRILQLGRERMFHVNRFQSIGWQTSSHSPEEWQPFSTYTSTSRESRGLRRWATGSRTGSEYCMCRGRCARRTPSWRGSCPAAPSGRLTRTYRNRPSCVDVRVQRVRRRQRAQELFVVIIQRRRRRDDVARPVRHVRHAVRIHRRKFRLAPLFRRADRSLADIADKAAGIRLLILDHRMERSVAPHHRLHFLARFVKTHEYLFGRETGLASISTVTKTHTCLTCFIASSFASCRAR